MIPGYLLDYQKLTQYRQRKKWPIAQNQYAAICSLAKTNIEYTTVYVGFFMDYWAMPHIPTHLAPYSALVDVPNKRATLPGTGNDILTTTYSKDAAKLTVALLDVPHGAWTKESFVVGESIAMRDYVKILEEATGTLCHFSCLRTSTESSNRYQI